MENDNQIKTNNYGIRLPRKLLKELMEEGREKKEGEIGRKGERERERERETRMKQKYHEGKKNTMKDKQR